MAKPFTETPILYGEDAIRFEEAKQRVDNMTPEERAANREELRKQVEEACKKWNLTIEI